MYNENESGRWVTVNGKHIFIKDGETEEDAYNRTFYGTKPKTAAPAEYTKGNTTYTIIDKNGKPYLQMKTGKITDSYRIVSAKDADKAYITVPRFGKISLNSDAGVQNLLKQYLQRGK